jgi:type IV pilus assembly protein PilM
MFGRWLDKNHSPIGLDLGTHRVRLLQLRRRGGRGGRGGLAVAAAADRELPADLPPSGPQRRSALAVLLRAMLRSGDFRGRQVISCVPAAAIQYKNLRLPRMPTEELRAALTWEASTRLNLGPAEKTVIQFYDAGEVRQGEEMRQEIILMAAPAETLDDHLALLLEADLKPLAIDGLPSALVRGLGAVGETGPDAAATVAVDVGHQFSKVVIARRGEVVFFKLVDIGGDKFDRAVAEKLNLSPVEAAELRRRISKSPAAGAEPLFGQTRREGVERAIFEAVRAEAGNLAHEVGLCLRYYSVTFRGKRPDKVLLAGGGATEPQLARVLNEDAGLTAEPARPLAGAETGGIIELDGSGPDYSQWTVAAGLATRESARATGAAPAGGVAA